MAKAAAGLILIPFLALLAQHGFREFPYEEYNPAPVPRDANEKTEWAFARLRPMFKKRSEINSHVMGRLSEGISGIRVVKDVEFTVRAGEVVGYLGPNGSG